ncbi:MgtC/SapB family protein [Parasulfitobacter algicola]|uniref:Protein MgtC n=1 Tax=Parasulfitobacter algicola TaxID=2614809 RepID=A0ABX2ITU9_9RHOB|nr:MgtC/SapB family protein [Sulfitobacter algicola]NSX54490.1 MgtC/SapB family protein [Sulfitobacter algicola]
MITQLIIVESLAVVQVYSDINISLLFATINMGFALAMGAIIGSERQFRGRMAGLRTNALVALGAAGFVVFAALFPDDINPTRVAAQVVSGIGFLGAGIIFRDGFNIQGINTAATLWCSAAVGLISGSGHLGYAAVLTSLIVFANLGLRPVVRKLKKAEIRNAQGFQTYQLKAACLHKDGKEIRTILLGSLGDLGLGLCQIVNRGDGDTAEIIVEVQGMAADTGKVEKVIGQLSLDSRVLRASWSTMDDDDITAV